MLTTCYLYEVSSAADAKERIVIGTNDGTRGNKKMKAAKQSSLPVDNVTQIVPPPVQNPGEKQSLYSPFQPRGGGSSSGMNSLYNKKLSPTASI